MLNFMTLLGYQAVGSAPADRSGKQQRFCQEPICSVVARMGEKKKKKKGGRRRRTHDIQSEGRVDKYAWKPLGCAGEGGREGDTQICPHREKKRTITCKG